MKGSTLFPASFVHCMSCVSHGSCLFGIWVHIQYMRPRLFLHGNPKLRPVQMENHLPIYRGGFRLVSIVPPYFLVTLGDIPQQFLLQESPRAALRRFRRFLHWACHKDRMGGQVHCICVRFFLASFCVLLGTRFMFKI